MFGAPQQGEWICYKSKLRLQIKGFEPMCARCISSPHSCEPHRGTRALRDRAFDVKSLRVESRKEERKKNKSLHEAQYKSRKLSDSRVYNWDPRPQENRASISNKQINRFVVDLQSASCANQGQKSMWETSLRISYDDYPLTTERKTVLQRETILPFCLKVQGGLSPWRKDYFKLWK